VVKLVFVVPPALAGERVDRALSTCSERPRAEIARWIAARAVSIDGKIVAKAAERVREGQRLEATPLPPPPSDAKPDPSVRFSVIYEDDELIVVDKPAGLVVHPAKGHWEGTLVHGLLAHGPLAEAESAGEGPPRPGIVHRIDKDTSGLLVVARTAFSREALKKQFAAHSIERVYDALAVGALPDRLTIETRYGRHPVDRKKFTGKRAPLDGKRAVTHVAVIERLGEVARVECRLETGRTHQIRVHLSEHGAPLLGDTLYGKPPRDPRVRAIGEALGRQALHARVLGFVHPRSKKRLRFEAPWPADFALAVASLRG
jgi:23S rRNA pseudouridine1911/1915/1917 synthase